MIILKLALISEGVQHAIMLISCLIPINIKYLGINDGLGFSSRGPDPTSDPLAELCELVKINKLNFGFAFDVDGDRLVIVNNEGIQLNPDSTLLLCIAGVVRNNGLKRFTISLDSSLSIEQYVK